LTPGKYSVNPLYPALKRLPFSGFQSSLIADRQCNPARDRNPAKGKPLLRQGTDGNFHSGPRFHRIFTTPDRSWTGYRSGRKCKIAIQKWGGISWGPCWRNFGFISIFFSWQWHPLSD